MKICNDGQRFLFSGTCAWALASTCTCVHVCVRVHVCVHACMCKRVRAYLNVPVCAWACAYGLHVWTHSHVCACGVCVGGEEMNVVCVVVVMVVWCGGGGVAWHVVCVVGVCIQSLINLGYTSI